MFILGDSMNTENANHIEKESSGRLQLVKFHLGQEDFGLDIMQIKEIMRIPVLTRIPKSPSHVAGVINLRGKIVSILDLSSLFGMKCKEQDDASRIIIIENEGLMAGIIVDSVSNVLNLDTVNMEKTPDMINSGVGAEYIEGVGKIGDEILILLNLKKVFCTAA